MNTEQDKILKEIEESGIFAPTFDTPDNTMVALKQLKRHGLIGERRKSQYELTDIGEEALEIGGFDKWKQKKMDDKDANKKIQKLTIKNLEGNIFHLKYWWVILIISGIIGLITGNILHLLEWIRG